MHTLVLGIYVVDGASRSTGAAVKEHGFGFAFVGYLL
jgi:hypothetical protein